MSLEPGPSSSSPDRLALLAGVAAAAGLTAGLAAWFWGMLPLPARVTVLTLEPLVALSALDLASRHPRTRPLVPAFALLAWGAAWAALVLAPRALDLPLSSLLLWPGIGFGVALGSSFGLRFVLAASLAGLVVAVASVFFVSGGTPWTVVFERLEPLVGTAFVLAAAARWLAPAGAGIDRVAKRTGLALGGSGLVALATVRGVSLLPLAPRTAQLVYGAVIVLMLAGTVRVRRRTASRTGSPPASPAQQAGESSRLVVASLVLLLSMGGLLGVARWNRGGEPRFIVLSERELAPRAGSGTGPGDLRLAFQWQPRDDAQDARVWLPDGRLSALGFSTGVMAGTPEGALFYSRSLPRHAWVAFELDGPAWRIIEQRLAMGRTGRAGELTPSPSRLVPIDASPDPAVLHRRYAGQPVVVLPAIVEMRHAADPRRGASVWGRVARLVSPDVSVPPHLRARVRRSGAPPRYEVVLGVGRLGAVWVEDLRELDQ